MEFAYSPDGEWIAVDKRYGGFQVWRAATKLLQFEIDDPVGPHAFSADSRFLALGAAGNLVRVWRTDDWREIATFATSPGSVASLSFSSDGQTLAISSTQGVIKLWSVPTGRELMTLAEDFLENPQVRFSPNGKMLVANGRTKPEAYGLRVWRLEK